jgi:glutathione S-transferase
MLTLYHSPMSRSGRIIWLLEELAADYQVVQVEIRRRDGSGGHDPKNPHPDGKVPALVHDGALITESSAIILYLTDLLPNSGTKLGPQIGDPERGPYLTWLAYYGDVMEPVYTLAWSGLADNPMLTATFRGVAEVEARLIGTLEKTPYLLGDTFTAADLLVCSPFTFMPDSIPDNKAVKDWLQRCMDRAAYRTAYEKDSTFG